MAYRKILIAALFRMRQATVVRRALLFGQNRVRREKAENPEQSGSQGWDVFSSSSRINFSEELPSTAYL
jgi:hypothetical protein